MNKITKHDAAVRQLLTAIGLFFEDGDPISVHTLAGAAQEVLKSQCEHHKIYSYWDIVKETFNYKTEKELCSAIKRYRNFFKHSDKDPDAILEDFRDTENDGILFWACFDLHQIIENIPIQCRVYMDWYLAMNQDRVGGNNPFGQIMVFPFPELAGKTRRDQKQIGLDAVIQKLKEAKSANETPQQPAPIGDAD